MEEVNETVCSMKCEVNVPLCCRVHDYESHPQKTGIKVRVEVNYKLSILLLAVRCYFTPKVLTF
jgi:hypothetical protein